MTPCPMLPGFMAELRAADSMSALALEFTILTAARTGEVVGARWPEIDLAAKVWTVPPKRTKNGREHRVPLSDRALEVLAALPREEGNDHVFIGARQGKGLSNMAMLELLRGMVENGLTVHGFRSSFRDWAGERTKLPARARRGGAGACALGQDRGRLSSRRCAEEAAPDDGRVDSLLRCVAGYTRVRGVTGATKP
jgi:integrase